MSATFKELAIPGVFLIEPAKFVDSRGWFSQLWTAQDLQENLGYPVNFVQENESFSTYGTIRGLHWQTEPCAQAKLIRVLEGQVLDVLLDIRQESHTFGEHLSVKLDASSACLFIPKGIAHGFAVLSKSARVNYKVDMPYSPANEAGIFYADSDLGIDWQLDKSVHLVSKKDLALPSFKDVL